MSDKELIDSILSETERAVLGKDEVLRRILCAILAGGHILIDDIPMWGRRRLLWLSLMCWGWITSGCSLRRMCCPAILPVFPCMTRIPKHFPLCGRFGYDEFLPG